MVQSGSYSVVHDLHRLRYWRPTDERVEVPLRWQTIVCYTNNVEAWCAVQPAGAPCHGIVVGGQLLRVLSDNMPGAYAQGTDVQDISD